MQVLCERCNNEMSAFACLSTFSLQFWTKYCQSRFVQRQTCARPPAAIRWRLMLHSGIDRRASASHQTSGTFFVSLILHVCDKAYNISLNFHRHLTGWPWMTLRGHFSSNSVFRWCILPLWTCGICQTGRDRVYAYVKVYGPIPWRPQQWKREQESCAIAKMTAQCAIYMGALKIFGTPDYYSQHFLRTFVRIDPLNVPTKFEVCSFIRSSDNRGYPKNLDSPWIRPRSFFSKFLTGFYSDWPD